MLLVCWLAFAAKIWLMTRHLLDFSICLRVFFLMYVFGYGHNLLRLRSSCASLILMALASHKQGRTSLDRRGLLNTSCYWSVGWPLL